jgi:FHA domain
MSDVWSSPAGTDRDRDAVLVEVHPGTGVVDRQDDTLLVIPTVEPDQWGHVAHLLNLWHRPGSRSADQPERTLSALLKEAEGVPLPGLAVLQGFTADASVLVYGDVEVVLNEPGARSFRGTAGRPWVKVRVGEPLALVQVRAVGGPLLNSGSALFHLREGTVPGSGVTVRVSRRAAEANEAQLAHAPPPPSANPAPVGSLQATTTHKAATFESVLLTTISDRMPIRRAALPLEQPTGEPEAAAGGSDQQLLVDGVECAAGHFNDPSCGHCATCGQTLASPHGQPVRRPRPTLGVLVTDNGSVFALDSGYVIGRAPERDDAVLSGRAKPLVLRDVGQSVSRVHAQLELDGWRVLVTDRGSSNGTFISQAGPVGPWERVGADTAMVFPPGGRLRIGGRQLLFESYREEVTDRTGGP